MEGIHRKESSGKITGYISTWEENKMKEVLKLPSGKREKRHRNVWAGILNATTKMNNSPLRNGKKNLVNDGEIEQGILNFWHLFI